MNKGFIIPSAPRIELGRDGFVDMVTVLPEKQESENFVLEHFEIDGSGALMETMRGIRTRPGKFVRLQRKSGFRDVVMSDTIAERNTNWRVVHEAEGDVLIAGFGIGMILVPILLNPKVNKVTVVEISKEVPAMVLPHLPNTDKLEVIYADILEWNPPKGKKWDIVYFDIWDHICADNLGDMKKLHKRFGRRKKKWMGSWARKECERQARHYGSRW